MKIRAWRSNKLRWPQPIGKDAHKTFIEFRDKMGDIPWFVMGRSLLQLMVLDELDVKDKDIDVAAWSEDEKRIIEALKPWMLVQRTYDSEDPDGSHQLLYQPNTAIIDIHFFRDPPRHVGYINQFNKWVTRPASRFDVELRDFGQYGAIPVPNDPEGFLSDDYGPLWRDKKVRR